MVILYLHGLESKGLSDEKERMIRDAFPEPVTIYKPVYDYSNTSFESIEEMACEVNPDLIIGSSLGGKIGFVIAQLQNVKALLFNPAIAKKQLDQVIRVPELSAVTKNHFFVFGAKDTTVFMKDTIDFLIKENDHIQDQSDLNHVVFDHLEHRLPAGIIKETLMMDKVQRFISE